MRCQFVYLEPNLSPETYLILVTYTFLSQEVCYQTKTNSLVLPFFK